MPRVSVNIPCYNSARFIEATIASVLSQTYGDFELVVVDDGSTDETYDIVRSNRDARIRLVRQDNHGLGQTRNRLLEMSTGEFVAFLDHDDTWSPQKLARQVEMFDTSGPDVALVYTDAYQVYEAGHRVLYSRFHRPRWGNVLVGLLEDYPILLSSAMVRRQVLVDVGGFPDYQIAEETKPFLEIAHMHEIQYINEPLVDYRFHVSNTSRKLNLYVREMLEILDRWRSEADPVIRSAAERQLGLVYYAAGRQALLHLGEPGIARRYLGQAARFGAWREAAPFIAASLLPASMVKGLRQIALRSQSS
jgi:glycosyltransferase involved in cell wall biosynthesis